MRPDHHDLLGESAARQLDLDVAYLGSVTGNALRLDAVAHLLESRLDIACGVFQRDGMHEIVLAARNRPNVAAQAVGKELLLRAERL